MEEYITKNELSSSVKLYGFKENPYKYMSVSDLFVCSSRTEGFSTVVTEAVILGIPIVTTDCPGMRELLGDSEFGIITENDSEALYNGLKRIILNKDLYRYYKNKIKKRSRKFKLIERINDIEMLLDK